jgi:hypothetical protein
MVGQQATRVREIYKIPGDAFNDKVEGVFCWSCSLTRTAMEMTRRERERRQSGMPYHDAIVSQEYSQGESMAYPLDSVDENGVPWVDRGPYGRSADMRSARVMPIYPGGKSRQVHLSTVPEGSPSTSFERDRSIRILPNSDENLPGGLWRSIKTPSPGIRGPGGNILQPTPRPRQHSLTNDQRVFPLYSTPPPQHNIDSDVRDDEVRAVAVAGHGLQVDNKVGIIVPASTEEHPISSDLQVAYKPVGASIHDLCVDDVTPVLPNQPADEHRVESDGHELVASVDASSHALAADHVIQVRIESRQEHSMDSDLQVEEWAKPDAHPFQADQKVGVQESAEPEPHPIHADQTVAMAIPLAEEHSIGDDSQVSERASKIHEHDLAASEPASSESLALPANDHALMVDFRVTETELEYSDHDLHVDDRIKMPAMLPPQEHYISADEQAQVNREVAREHGIRADALVPEVEETRRAHSLDADPRSRMLAGQDIGLEEHNIHADSRVATPVFSFIPQHGLVSDKRVKKGIAGIKEHDIEDDDMIPSSAMPKSKKHWIGADPKVVQRASQLLQHFLDDDKARRRR